MLFHTMIVGMVAIRSPTDWAVACGLASLLMRIIMVFGYYCNKEAIWVGAGGLETLMNFILMFIGLAHSQWG